MNDRKFSEIPCQGTPVRVIYDQLDSITHICLDDICAILHRERMLQDSSLMKICPTAIQIGEPSILKNLPWYVKPFDITRLTRRISKEGKIAAMACEEIERWLATLPWGNANRGSEDTGFCFDAVGVTKNTLKMEFQGQDIAFRIIDNRVYVNATQMAHIYNMLPSAWLRKTEVVKWMDELVSEREFPDLESQVVTMKGKYGGTWIEQRLGIEYTRFLGEELHEWYMGALRNLLPDKYGMPRKNGREPLPEPQQLPATLEESHKMIHKLQQRITEDRPKVDFYNEYVEDRDWFKSMRVADELEISPYRLHQFLMEQGICSYEKRQWVVKPKYQALQAEIPYLWTNPQGKTYAFGKIRRWTQAGREYIIELYRKFNA